MTTERQRLANQRNARLSHGPISADGKARSRRNALKHGLSAKVLVDPASIQQIEDLAQGNAQDTPRDVARELAAGESALRQIRLYQHRLLSMIDAKITPLSQCEASLGGGRRTNTSSDRGGRRR
jgi:hypothetical protein